MKFLNTDGMAFIGPGSEWFWTAVSGIVLAVTFIAIYRQLSLARGANAREQLASSDAEWTSERLIRCKFDVLVALRDGADRASIPDGAAQSIGLYWERIGALTHGGHIDPKLLHSFNGGACPVWWAALAPFVRKLRTEYGDPTEYREFEWLAGSMRAMDRRVGASAFDEAMLAGQLNQRIAELRDRLRFEQALRSVIVATPDPATIEELATAPARPAATEAAAQA